MDILSETAKKNGVSREDLEMTIQAAIDKLWNSLEEDSPAFKKMRKKLGRKPDPEEYVMYLAGIVKEDVEGTGS